MNVRELIEALAKCPPDFEVRIDDVTIEYIVLHHITNVVGSVAEGADSYVEFGT